ncbi:tripartite tricarboxylate transporter substrate binding protein [uncultured Pigmentiphaga sp.]|uniref:Bug family tripartite tricarboxylate transporter substrate binding protein n=1 Tax=uncultured Pigmentiphaga sp. TaxID=340361 RepID=UPI00261D1A94|nr:tripartite tricarboxylate transporter substrate binding protein [uncultured Pigmentiphaga sp.]
MKIIKGAILLPLAMLSALAAAPANAADSAYPDKMVRIVVPFTAGGGTSNTARFLADKLAAKWNQPVIVDNRPGGNTVIGSNIVAKAEPDGYTLLFANTSHTINPAVMPKLPYDSVRDFKPITTVLVNRFVLLAHPSMQVDNLDQFISKLRAKPDDYNLPTVGAAGIGRLANESLMNAIGVKLQNIPYKGTSDLATNLIGGQLKFALEIPGFYLQHIKSGKLKVLAVSGQARLSSLPEVPTFAEKKVNFDAQSWYGLLAPGGTPDAVVDKIAADVREIVASSEFKTFLDSIQSEAFVCTPAEFADFIQREMKKNREIAEQAGITAES